ANLVLTRATARAPELALRRALGASAARLTRQVLTESLVLAAIGGVAGVALGLIPAWRVLRADVVDALRPAGRVVSERSQARLRHAFVVGQFCLATMLVIGATLL